MSDQVLVKGRTHVDEPGYTNIRREGFMAIASSIVAPSDMWTIIAAYQFAKAAHRNQVRDNGRRYFDHPREVALMLMQEFGTTDWQSIVIALLHDVEEDSFLLFPEVVQKIFGADVALSLRRLTKIPKEGYFERLVKYGTVRDLKVKLVDRAHNFRTLYACTPEKQTRYIEETKRDMNAVFDRFDFLSEQKDDWIVDRIGGYFEEFLGKREKPSIASSS